ncbi:MAG TPA: biopolymer transporter ExbD [Nevskiaceae bacterium]|nr:biopolymer transporter ExbD [Nevskiaceae bacterium]
MSNRRKERKVERAARRAATTVHLNIVSLIDIFAILVFYLLVNALVVEVLPNPKALKLPESVVKDQPRTAVVITVSREDILVDNRPVLSVAEAEATEGSLLPRLKSELLLSPLMRVEGDAMGRVTRGEVNILADRTIPYRLLKKVMATCTEARFARISLAVTEKKGAGEEAP